MPSTSRGGLSSNVLPFPALPAPKALRGFYLLVSPTKRFPSHSSFQAAQLAAEHCNKIELFWHEKWLSAPFFKLCASCSRAKRNRPAIHQKGGNKKPGELGSRLGGAAPEQSRGGCCVPVPCPQHQAISDKMSCGELAGAQHQAGRSWERQVLLPFPPPASKSHFESVKICQNRMESNLT